MIELVFFNLFAFVVSVEPDFALFKQIVSFVIDTRLVSLKIKLIKIYKHREAKELHAD